LRLLLPAAALLLLPLSGFAMGSRTVEYPVVFVADGDTVRVVREGAREWVRLLRIDTPERDERGYSEARDALDAMVGEKSVNLVFEKPGFPERDAHGRLLAYVFYEGRNVNVEMVRQGWSRFWTRYGKGRFSADFSRAEKEARGEGRGLWRKELQPPARR
jgi:micrococcal nuclease